MQPELAALEAAGELKGRILDAGCGTGEAALYLAGKCHQVWGMDHAALAVEQARAKAAERGITTVHWAVQDLLELPFAGL